MREEAHALLIAVYAREGSRSQVNRQYRRLRGILARELGVEPLPETTQAYQQALALTWARSAQHAALRRRPPRTGIQHPKRGRIDSLLPGSGEP